MSVRGAIGTGVWGGAPPGRLQSPRTPAARGERAEGPEGREGRTRRRRPSPSRGALLRPLVLLSCAMLREQLPLELELGRHQAVEDVA